MVNQVLMGIEFFLGAYAKLFGKKLPFTVVINEFGEFIR